MSLSINDTRIFRHELKKARKRLYLTQETCAELLEHSLSFQKDLKRGRCSTSIENFYHICRTLNISADGCIFPDNHNTDSTYHKLLRLLSQCNKSNLKILTATAELSMKRIAHQPKPKNITQLFFRLGYILHDKYLYNIDEK